MGQDKDQDDTATELVVVEIVEALPDEAETPAE